MPLLYGLNKNVAHLEKVASHPSAQLREGENMQYKRWNVKNIALTLASVVRMLHHVQAITPLDKGHRG
jgi:hypothetical protein